MGLDQYLSKKIYIGANYDHRKVFGDIDIKIGGKPIKVNFDKVTYIEEQAAYWCKANQIHAWFVKNVQEGEDDCRDYYVTADQLKELLALCKEVKRKAILKPALVQNGSECSPETGGEWTPCLEMGQQIENAEEIHKLLPCQSGFFFGSTHYDSYYMEDIDNTIEMLTEALNDDTDGDFYYHASW